MKRGGVGGGIDRWWVEGDIIVGVALKYANGETPLVPVDVAQFEFHGGVNEKKVVGGFRAYIHQRIKYFHVE